MKISKWTVSRVAAILYLIFCGMAMRSGAAGSLQQGAQSKPAPAASKPQIDAAVVYNENSEIPILAGRRLRPTASPDTVEEDEDGLALPVSLDWRLPNADSIVDKTTFATTDEAVATALKHLYEHATAVTPPAMIQADIQSYEKNTAGFEGERWITFNEYVGTIPTLGVAEIVFRGKTCVRVRNQLHEFALVPNTTKRIIRKEEATAAWEQVAKNLGKSLREVVGSYSQLLPSPRLMFIESYNESKNILNGITYKKVFHPTWVLDGGRRICVNAHTGQPWLESDNHTLSAKPLEQPASQPGAPQTEGEPRPLLRSTPMKPIFETDEFKKAAAGGFRYPAKHIPAPAAEEPFATDDEAVLAAREWITKHFGEFPRESTLAVETINHSANGSDKPATPGDRGHTISFVQAYDGIITDRYAIIYIRGKTKFSASLGLATLTPVKDSAKKVVTKEIAHQAWRKLFAVRGVSDEKLLEMDARVKPQLEYKWAHAYNKEFDPDISILAPTWVLIPKSPLMVDGHTGDTWYND